MDLKRPVFARKDEKREKNNIPSPFNETKRKSTGDGKGDTTWKGPKGTTPVRQVMLQILTEHCQEQSECDRWHPPECPRYK